MKYRLGSWHKRVPWLLAAAILPSSAMAQVADTDSEEEEEVFDLSPFQVKTSDDRGYYASNTISGSRISVAMQEMPMSIEVITSEFIEDTASVDLRESLRYSSGVVLDSQADPGNSLGGDEGKVGVPGGVHGTGGATSAISNTVIKTRGFITESSLRKGFSRQHGSDSVNIARVEVVRGPAALLYGIGNFGGIVNYLPKRPLGVEQTEVTAMVGSEGFLRTTFDHNKPLNDKLGFRITSALENSDHWTQHQGWDKFFVSPVIEYRPTDKTQITLDIEFGNDKINGIGFQRLRARADLGEEAITQPGRLEKTTFVTFDGTDPATFRLSGPDTFVENEASNVLFEVNHNILDGLDLMVGYNRSVVETDVRDVVNAAYLTEFGPENLWGTIEVEPFRNSAGDELYDSEIAPDERTASNVVLAYQWGDTFSQREREEVKFEVNYQLGLFEESELLYQKHSFLAGYSTLRADSDVEKYVTGAGRLANSLYRSPEDLSPIRFGPGIQDNGTPNGVLGLDEFVNTQSRDAVAYNQGLYGVWQGKMLKDRLTTIFGVRRDRSDQRISFMQLGADDVMEDASPPESEHQTQNTTQWGVSYEVVDGLNIFALRSEGLEPNFQGLVDGNGNAIKAKFAESEEAGVKLNLFGGRLAAQATAYKIEVTGPSAGLASWWTPAPAKGLYDPTKATVYNLGGGVIADWNAAYLANQDTWNAALDNGDAFYVGDIPYITVLDANGNDTAAGAPFMDALYQWAADGKGWPGWMFAGSQSAPDGISNNAAMDWGAGDNGFAASLAGKEQSEGYEFQLLATPIDNWQIMINYAYTERKITDPGIFPKYPYPQDRWAIWYFPDGNWGLQGSPLDQAYEDPSDTSTWTGGPTSTKGLPLDDTPAHDYSMWTAYTFNDGKFAGLKVGVGGYYQSKRNYLTGFQRDGGNAITDEEGRRISLYTKPKYIMNAMLRYDWEMNDNPTYLQLNIDNLLDEDAQFGFAYEPPLSWRLQAGMTF